LRPGLTPQCIFSLGGEGGEKGVDGEEVVRNGGTQIGRFQRAPVADRNRKGRGQAPREEVPGTRS